MQSDTQSTESHSVVEGSSLRFHISAACRASKKVARWRRSLGGAALAVTTLWGRTWGSLVDPKGSGVINLWIFVVDDIGWNLVALVGKLLLLMIASQYVGGFITEISEWYVWLVLQKKYWEIPRTALFPCYVWRRWKRPCSCIYWHSDTYKPEPHNRYIK